MIKKPLTSPERRFRRSGNDGNFWVKKGTKRVISRKITLLPNPT